MSLNAYQTAATRNEDPRSTEYRLFAQVTRALMEASQTEKTDLAARIDALDWNRRVWTNLAADCASQDNQLPDQVRAGIISLSIFVSKHTSVVMRGNDDFETLIDINKTIMQGLAPQANAPQSGTAA